MAVKKKSKRKQTTTRPAAKRRAVTPPRQKPIRIPASKPEPQPLVIAGIGASAGGLDVFRQLLQALPTDTGMAIVLVQHLAPTHDSALRTLLADATTLPVIEATDGAILAANTIYVIPPNAQLGIRSGILQVTPRPTDRSQHMPIDYFFRALAEDAQGRAIGVVLSGTASDGAAGLREIKAVGGITIAQKPETARFDGMPRAAIATGIVDLILPPDEIAAALARIAHHPYVKHARPRRDGDEIEIPDQQFHKIFQLLRQTSGVDFGQYKPPTILRRIRRRMVLHRIATVEQYIRFLEENTSELHTLYSDLLIHVTRFFREPESFKALTTAAFPHIADSRPAEQAIRIWVPGCSTGEEPYSIAIALLEFLGKKAVTTPIQIFATDVSDPAIDHARAGTFPPQHRRGRPARSPPQIFHPGRWQLPRQ